MKLLKNNFVIALLVIFLGVPELLDAQGYYNRYEYRRKRHEIPFGAGASSCLTDVGGSDLDQTEFDTTGVQDKITTKSFPEVDFYDDQYAVINAIIRDLQDRAPEFQRVDTIYEFVDLIESIINILNITTPEFVQSSKFRQAMTVLWKRRETYGQLANSEEV